MANIQITHSLSTDNARSESAVLINPNNPQQIVAASKKFKHPHTYDFTLATSYSTDGGLTWHDSADVPIPGWDCLTDPTLAWDDVGNVYFVGLPGTNPPTFNTIGIAVYKSTDGGKTWSNPNLIHTSVNDDKQWAAGDANPASPFHGRIYAVWDDLSTMRFARSLDHGATWIGTGANPVGSSLATDSFSPEINVSANGNIYVVWIAGNVIKMIASTDGGNSFHPVTPPATGVTTLSASLAAVDGWPVFPGGSFRVLTVPTACVFGDKVAVAWDDFREGVSRIYYAHSNDGGATWTTGATGQPLLTAALPANMQHFFPQIITDPNGIIGCAFYEFGPKPSTYKIDVLMATSYDGGSTFDHFTVTEAPWDPVVDAPWAHGDPKVTFIGDYFGIDASGKGFYPVWTDTRTGIQELWTEVVPKKTCMFYVERSTLGQDEIDARRAAGSPVVPEAFRVVVDGFSGAELGVVGPASTLNVGSPAAGITITCTGNTSGNLDYGPEVQRFTFHYNIDFGATDTAFGFPGPNEFLTLSVSVPSASASAQIELIKQPNPFILHGDPAWLSVDLRVFVVREGETRFGRTLGDASDAPGFIRDVMHSLTSGHGTAGGQAFDGLSTDEEGSSLYVYPTDNNGKKVFNFALAKVHYIGTIGAAHVRVFFRLFQAQSTNAVYDIPPGNNYPSTGAYRFWSDGVAGGKKIPLAGIRGIEYVTIPCFAQPRIDSTVAGMDQQTDPANIQTISAGPGGAEVDVFFGCWLDINQPFKADGVTSNNVLPLFTPAFNRDGPFTDPLNPPLTVQQAIIRNLHECLIAEIAFDPVAIPVGKDPGNWDKLAQRNIAWSDIGSAKALSTFEIRPTALGLPAGQTADELMIDWGNTPKGSLASIFLPATTADAILSMASRMYTSHRLARADEHTLQCRTGGITYIPIPPGVGVDYAGLLSVEVPGTARQGGAYTVVVRQVTNAFGTRKQSDSPPAKGHGRRRQQAAETGPPAPGESAPPAALEWRRVLGAFQLTIPVKTKALLLETAERQLSVMQWIGEAIPASNRWYEVFKRYLLELGGRVTVFGGNPGQICPSPTGHGKPKPHHHHKHEHEGHEHEEHEHEGHEHKGPEREKHTAFTGKVAGLIYDRFGDFEGFLLDTEDGERKFFSREREMAELAERVWRERLRITVWTEHQEPHRPLSIVLRQPPTPF